MAAPIEKFVFDFDSIRYWGLIYKTSYDKYTVYPDSVLKFITLFQIWVISTRFFALITEETDKNLVIWRNSVLQEKFITSSIRQFSLANNTIFGIKGLLAVFC